MKALPLLILFVVLAVCIECDAAEFKPSEKMTERVSVSDGAITVSCVHVVVCSEEGIGDVLSTITGDRDVVVLVARGGHTITVQEGGNVMLSAGKPCVLTLQDRLWLRNDKNGKWHEILRHIRRVVN